MLVWQCSRSLSWLLPLPCLLLSVLQGLPSALRAAPCIFLLPTGAGEWVSPSLICPRLLAPLQIALVYSEGWLTSLHGTEFPRTVSSVELSAKLSSRQLPSPHPVWDSHTALLTALILVSYFLPPAFILWPKEGRVFVRMTWRSLSNQVGEMWSEWRE